MSRLPARVLLPSGERPAPTEAGAETGAAAERHWRSLAPRHALRRAQPHLVAKTFGTLTKNGEVSTRLTSPFFGRGRRTWSPLRSGRLVTCVPLARTRPLGTRFWSGCGKAHWGNGGRGSVARFPTQVPERAVLVWCYGKFSGPKRAKKSGKSPKKREILLTKTDTVPIL